MIYALASLITFDKDPAMQSTWDRIQRVFEIAGMTLTELPHFSWHVAEEYDFERLGKRLDQVVKNLSPVNLHIAGAGIFSGENPVIYLPVTKTPRISAIHTEISTWIRDYTSTTNPNYDPDFWIPHITLSSEGFNSDGICQVISELAYIPMNVGFPVDHFAILYKNDTSSGVRDVYRFGNGSP